jgi:hypothetical protein
MKGDDDMMNQISLKDRFGYVLDMFSTCFQQLFAFFDKSLVFFVFASKIRQLLITAEDCCHFAPPKEDCCHFAPPRATCVTCAVKREDCCHFAPLRRELGGGLQTESKGNFESMSLYRHKNFPTPKIFPKNSHFFKPSQTRRAVTSRRRIGVLSLRAADQRR